MSSKCQEGSSGKKVRILRIFVRQRYTGILEVSRNQPAIMSANLAYYLLLGEW